MEAQDFNEVEEPQQVEGNLKHNNLYIAINNDIAEVNSKGGIKDIKEDEIIQAQETNHQQYNLIEKLKKDWKFWQDKCLDITLNHQLSELDLKRAKRAKTHLLKENKSLKETTNQLQTSAQEKENQLNEGRIINLKSIVELKEENNRLTKLLEEAEKKNKEPMTETEIVNEFFALPDIQSMGRVLNILQMNFHQKYYAYMMNQQKSATGSSEAVNGSMPTGDQMTNGNYMMAGQMVNPMQYNMGAGMYQDPSQSNMSNPSQQ